MLRGSWFLLLLSSFSIAAEMPGGLGAVSGTLLTGVTSRATIKVTPGDPGLCSRTAVSPIISYACPNVSGATVTVAGDGATLTIPIDRLHVFYKSLHRGNIWQYDMSGNWVEGGVTSRVVVTVWFDERTRNDVRGSFSLDDFGMYGSIRATQAPRRR